jgi:hypothetical protein
LGRVNQKAIPSRPASSLPELGIFSLYQNTNFILMNFWYDIKSALALEGRMAYDHGLAFRIEELLEEVPGLVTKKMFGGIGYLINGNMLCGVFQHDLIVRLSVTDYREALQKPYTRKFDITGREMRGWLLVNPDGTSEEEDLRVWIAAALLFNSSLPPK